MLLLFQPAPRTTRVLVPCGAHSEKPDSRANRVSRFQSFPLSLGAPTSSHHHHHHPGASPARAVTEASGNSVMGSTAFARAPRAPKSAARWPAGGAAARTMPGGGAGHPQPRAARREGAGAGEGGSHAAAARGRGSRRGGAGPTGWRRAPGERAGRASEEGGARGSAGRSRPRPAPPAPPARNSSPKVAAGEARSRRGTRPWPGARSPGGRRDGHSADQGQPGGESQPGRDARPPPRKTRLLGVAAAACRGQGGARGRWATPLPPARRHGPGAAADGAPGPAGGGGDAAAAPAPGERREGERGARRLPERPAPARCGVGGTQERPAAPPRVPLRRGMEQCDSRCLLVPAEFGASG